MYTSLLLEELYRRVLIWLVRQCLSWLVGIRRVHPRTWTFESHDSSSLTTKRNRSFESPPSDLPRFDEYKVKRKVWVANLFIGVEGTLHSLVVVLRPLQCDYLRRDDPSFTVDSSSPKGSCGSCRAYHVQTTYLHKQVDCFEAKRWMDSR